MNETAAAGVWRGVDISYINEMEDCGAVYRVGGEIRDPYRIFADKGANLARFRLWHNPDWTEYSTLPDVMKSILGAKDNGMRVLLDFHYSDDWADPQNQRIPAAWQEAGSVEEVAELLYDYTFTTLMALHEQGLVPDYVQVGNEINSGIARADPEQDAWWENPERNVRLLNAGIMAVRHVGAEVERSLGVVLHFSKPEEVEHWLDTANRKGLADFDIIGVSYYSQWSEVSLSQLDDAIRRLRNKYGKEVAVVETAYPWTLAGNDSANNILSGDAVVEGYGASQPGQRQYLIDLMQAVLNGGGLGIIYWEPAWVSTGCSTRWGRGSHWENATLFNYENTTLHAGADFLSHKYSTDETQTPHSGTGDTFIQKRHQVKKAIEEFTNAPGGTTWALPTDADGNGAEAAPPVLSFGGGADEPVLGGTFIDKYQYLERGNSIYVSDPGGTTWTGTAWQGERVHAPLVVWANDSAWQGTLEYEMSDLAGGYDGVISNDRVRILYPTYVAADPERRGCGEYGRRTGIETVYLADALSTTPAPVELPDDMFKVWLAIDVPADAAPGSYRGLFVVRDPALEEAELIFSVNLVVQAHRLPPPSDWEFELNVWQHPEWVLKRYNDEHPEALIKRWSAGHYDLLEGSYRLLGDAGQKWVTTTLKDGAHGAPGLVSWRRMREDEHDWRFDFSAFGAHVEMLTEWGIGPRIEAFGILGWNRDEIPYWSNQYQQVRVLDAPAGSVAHRAAWRAFLPAFRSYLEEKGWFEQTWLSIDESDAETLRTLVELIRADDPDWNIAVSYFVTDLPADLLELATATNIHLGIAGEAGLPNTAENIRTIYTSCADGSSVNAFVTRDSNPAEVAWLTWYAGKLERDGYSRWAYDYWRAADPLDLRQLSHTSGDTALVYRTSNGVDLEVMTSVRLELLRDGIQQSEKRRIVRELYAGCRYTTGVALLDGLVADNYISLERASNGLVRDDLVRAREQLDIVSADAQAIASGCD